MENTYQIYLISDSTGETLDRIFLALQAQFSNFKYQSHQYSFAKKSINVASEICVFTNNNIKIEKI